MGNHHHCPLMQNRLDCFCLKLPQIWQRTIMKSFTLAGERLRKLRVTEPKQSEAYSWFGIIVHNKHPDTSRYPFYPDQIPSGSQVMQAYTILIHDYIQWLSGYQDKEQPVTKWRWETLNGETNAWNTQTHAQTLSRNSVFSLREFIPAKEGSVILCRTKIIHDRIVKDSGCADRGNHGTAAIIQSVNATINFRHF